MGKKKKGGCPGGICGRRPATPQAAPQNKYQAKAQKKIDKAQAKSDIKVAKQEAKQAVDQAKNERATAAAAPTVFNGPQSITPEMLSQYAQRGQPGLPGQPGQPGQTGLQALNGYQPPLGGLPEGGYSPNPITYGLPEASFLKGTKPTMQYYPLYNPEQQYALDQLLRMGIGRIPGQNELDFEPIAERSRREFTNQTVPSLAERFTSLGGGQRSSAFQGALGNAASDLQSQLSAMRSKYGLLSNEQRFNQALPLLQAGLGRRHESVFNPAQSSGIGSFFAGIAPGIGQAAGSAAKFGLGF